MLRKYLRSCFPGHQTPSIPHSCTPLALCCDWTSTVQQLSCRARCQGHTFCGELHTFGASPQGKLKKCGSKPSSKMQTGSGSGRKLHQIPGKADLQVTRLLDVQWWKNQQNNYCWRLNIERRIPKKKVFILVNQTENKLNL